VSPRRGAWAAALAIVAAAWLFLYAPQLVGGQTFVRGDATAFRPFTEFSRERWLERHERTHWNPYVFAGLPASASLADTRPQWLPDPLLDLWEAPGRSPSWPHLLPALLVHLAGMLACGALARALWSSGPVGFVTAALAFGLAPNVALPVAYGHDAQLVAVAAMPIPLLAAHALAAARAGRGALAGALGLAASLGAIGLAGHPQYVAYAGALGLAFGIERVVRFGRPRRALALVAALVAAALASAAVWLPARAYLAESVRAAQAGGVGLVETGFWSLGARDALGFVWPQAAGFGGATYWGSLRFTEWPQYLGVTVLALAALAFARRRPGETGATWFWAAVAALALALAFGVRWGGAWTALAGAIPFWSMFRVALASVAVAHLALALLAARGLERGLLERDESAARRRHGPVIGSFLPAVAAAGIAAACAALALVGAAPGAALHEAYLAAARAARPALDIATASALAGDALRDLGLRAALLAILPAAWALVPATRAGRVALAGLALGLVTLDLAPDAARVLRGATGPREALAAPPPSALAAAALADVADGAQRGALPPRIVPLDFGSLYSNDPVSWRVPSLGGFHGTAPRRWNELRESNALGAYAVWCRLGVRYAAGAPSVTADSALFAPLRDAHARDTGVAFVRGALERAQPVQQVIALPDDPRVLEALQAPDFDPTLLAFTTDGSAAGSFPGSRALAWRWETDEPDHIALAVGAPEDAFLVLADAWFPGWSATLDGRPVRIVRIDHYVRGVRVSPGARRLEFRYEPEGWGTGRALTLASWGAMLALALVLAVFALRPRGRVLAR
jgi:hypothetical protein